MEKKYELTNNTIEINGHILYQIRALRSVRISKRYFSVEDHAIKVILLIIPFGSLGGYIEFEENLSHYGECWITSGSSVYGESTKVIDNALVDDNCLVSNSLISGESNIYGHSYNDMIVTNSIILGRSVLNCSRFISSVAIDHVISDDEIYRNDRCYCDIPLDDFEKVILWKNGLLERNMN